MSPPAHTILDDEVYDNDVENKPLSEDMYYAIVIDAGSTGSRALALTFKKTLSGTFELKKELLEKVTPGLCSFRDDPQKGAESIRQLLSKVTSVVPVKYQKKTPLVLRATAGLRSIPTKKSDGLINEVEKLFKQYPYFKYKNSVAIMDGVHEGIFSWFTVNFLLGSLNDKSKKTVAALDLGGGSIQITFIPTDVNEIKKESPKFITEQLIMNKKVNLYSHSYLKLGLVAARNSMVTVDGHLIQAINSCVQVVDKETPLNCTQNTCSETGESLKHSPAVDYLLCKSTIEAVVKAVDTHHPKDLLNHEIVAFSNFFDTAKAAGLVSEKGGKVTIKSFYEAAELECSQTSHNKLCSFLCYDLTYISVLMEKGFSLPVETSVTLLKFIDGHEISWALGLGYHILQNGLETDIV